MADDDRRVVPKPMVVAGGMTATPEGIAELERRRIQNERIARPPPAKSFAAVLGKGRSEAREEPEPSEKEKKLAALPKNGPRPALAHPSQRDTFGRADDSDDTVVLKG